MKKQSRFLSLVLRHKPEAGNLTLDSNGWAQVDDVLRAIRENIGEFSREELATLVRENDKQRFTLEGDRIRANQGHSLDVDLEMQPCVPPPVLYHGTKLDFMDSIRREGLTKRARQHVHLSPDRDTAEKVAARRKGESLILVIRSGEMTQPFYQSANGVWLTDTVPPEFIEG